MAFKLGQGVVEVGLAGVGNVASGLGKVAGMMSGFGGKLAGLIPGIGQLGMGVMGISMLGSSIKGFMHDAAEGARGLTRLDAALVAQGNVAGWTAEQLQKFAEEQMKTTEFSDEATVGAMTALARMSNVRGDVFKQATKSAQDMAAMMGGNLSGSAQMLGRALQAPERGMMMLRRQGIIFTQDQQKQVKALVQSGKMQEAQGIILDQVNKSYGGAAAKMGATFGGLGTRISNAVGDVGKGIGARLLPIATGVTTFILDKVVPAFETFGGWIADFIAGVAEWFGKMGPSLSAAWDVVTNVFSTYVMPVLEAVVDGIITGIEFTLTVIKEWPLAWDFAVKQVTAALLDWQDRFRGVFLEVIPKYLLWFYNNFWNVLSDIAMFIGTVTTNVVTNLANWAMGVVDIFVNLGKNIWEVVKNSFGTIWKAMKQAFSGDLGGAFDTLMEGGGKNFNAMLSGWGDATKRFNWTPLTTGLDSAMTEALPDVGSYTQSDATKAAVNDAGTAMNKFSEKLPEHKKFKFGFDPKSVKDATEKATESLKPFDTGMKGSGEKSSYVGLADLSKNMQASVFKAKDPTKIAEDQLSTQQQMLEQQQRTNELLGGGGEDMGGGATYQ